MIISLVTKLLCHSSVCMCDSQTNHSSCFVPVAGSKIEHVLFATGCRHRSKSVPETMTHVTGFCWYQKLVLETGQCVMGLSDYKTSAG